MLYKSKTLTMKFEPTISPTFKRRYVAVNNNRYCSAGVEYELSIYDYTSGFMLVQFQDRRGRRRTLTYHGREELKRDFEEVKHDGVTLTRGDNNG